MADTKPLIGPGTRWNGPAASPKSWWWARRRSMASSSLKEINHTRYNQSLRALLDVSSRRYNIEGHKIISIEERAARLKARPLLVTDKQVEERVEPPTFTLPTEPEE